MLPVAASMFTVAIKLCQPTSTASSMTSTDTTPTRGRGKSATITCRFHHSLCPPDCVWHFVLRLILLQLSPTHLSCLCSRFILRESSFPRYLHSAVLLSGTLLIFGGNTHNDTSLSNGAKCFSADFLAYDIGKDSCWCWVMVSCCFINSESQELCMCWIKFSCDLWKVMNQH